MVFTMLLAPIHVQASQPPVLITEVQTGLIDSAGKEFPLQEFVELTNLDANRTEVTNWRLEYLAASNNGTAGPTSLIGTLTGHISAKGSVLFVHAGYNIGPPDLVFGDGDASASGFFAKSGGHLRLMNGTTMVDCVAWGSATTISGCDKVSQLAGPGATIQRPLIAGAYDKSVGVVNVAPATPRGGSLFTEANDPSPISNPIQPNPQPAVPGCQGVVLSEIMSNPAGDDTLGEYIELFNPTTEAVPLTGCSLKIANGKSYSFTASQSIGAQQYLTFGYAITNLALANSGGSVTLNTANGQETVSFPALSDDQAFAKIDGIWMITNRGTPNAANILVLGDLPAAKTDEKNTSTTPASCPSGQERNPATNRCRRIVASVQSTSSCPAGQSRNPQTGRCRKDSTATAGGNTTNCPSGQERNPATNRCRKAATTGKVLSANTNKPTGSFYQRYLIIAVLCLIIVYAVYEYRHDIATRYRQLQIRFRRKG